MSDFESRLKELVERYCWCARWRRYTHYASEHPVYEAKAWSLTPRRWKREHPGEPLPSPLTAEKWLVQ